MCVCVCGWVGVCVWVGGRVCVCVRALLSLSICFPSLFMLCAVFISLQVGLGLIFRWSETKIFYFGVVYKFLSMGMELGVIKEVFIILYI